MVMEQRKGDPRVYIITFLFLSCIISGGVFLGLYLLLSDPNPLFLQAGMLFVGVPWLFWFLAYVYSCILKPCTVSLSNSVANFDIEKGQDKDKKNKNYDDNVHEKSTLDSDLVDASSSPTEGEKHHVQFGNVDQVLGDEQ
ncbi:unnamed protein product [Cochlearia groenlandica]